VRLWNRDGPDRSVKIIKACINAHLQDLLIEGPIGGPWSGRAKNLSKMGQGNHKRKLVYRILPYSVLYNPERMQQFSLMDRTLPCVLLYRTIQAALDVHKEIYSSEFVGVSVELRNLFRNWVKREPGLISMNYRPQVPSSKISASYGKESEPHVLNYLAENMSNRELNSQSWGAYKRAELKEPGSGTHNMLWARTIELKESASQVAALCEKGGK
jgi:hypothetical protein